MLIGVPLGWSPSTDGVVSGQPILTPFERQATPKRFERAVDEFIEKYKGKLRGQIILITDLKDVNVQSEVAMRRLSGDDHGWARPRVVTPEETVTASKVIAAAMRNMRPATCS